MGTLTPPVEKKVKDGGGDGDDGVDGDGDGDGGDGGDDCDDGGNGGDGGDGDGNDHSAGVESKAKGSRCIGSGCC